MFRSVNEYLTLSQGISTAIIPQWIKTVVLQKFKCRLLTFTTFVILKTGKVN